MGIEISDNDHRTGVAQNESAQSELHNLTQDVHSLTLTLSHAGTDGAYASGQEEHVKERCNPTSPVQNEPAQLDTSNRTQGINDLTPTLLHAGSDGGYTSRQEEHDEEIRKPTNAEYQEQIFNIVREWGDVFDEHHPATPNHIQFLAEGGLNCVFRCNLSLNGASLSLTHDTNPPQTHKIVFRFPHDQNHTDPPCMKYLSKNLNIIDTRTSHSGVDYHILDQVVTLTYLRKQNLKVPYVYAFDATIRNPLGRPYICLEYVPGVPLRDELPKMDPNALIYLAEQVVDFRLALASVQLPKCYGTQSAKMGRVVCSDEICSSGNPLVQKISPNNLEAWHHFLDQQQRLVETIPFITLGAEDGSEDGSDDAATMHLSRQDRACYDSVQELFVGEQKRFSDAHERRYRGMDDMTGPWNPWDSWQAFVDLTKNMPALCPPAEKKLFLFHTDLKPCNIMVELESRVNNEIFKGEQWNLKMIIDLEDLCCGDLILASKPCTWLWDRCRKANTAWIKAAPYSHFELDETGEDDIPMGWYHSQVGHLTEEEHMIKKAYDDYWYQAWKRLIPGMTLSQAEAVMHELGTALRRGVIPFTNGKQTLTGCYFMIIKDVFGADLSDYRNNPGRCSCYDCHIKPFLRKLAKRVEHDRQI